MKQIKILLIIIILYSTNSNAQNEITDFLIELNVKAKASLKTVIIETMDGLIRSIGVNQFCTYASSFVCMMQMSSCLACVGCTRITHFC